MLTSLCVNFFFRHSRVARFGVGGDVGYGDVNEELKVLINVNKGIVQY